VISHYRYSIFFKILLGIAASESALFIPAASDRVKGINILQIQSVIINCVKGPYPDIVEL
jgi:hypothetical protein